MPRKRPLQPPDADALLGSLGPERLMKAFSAGAVDSASARYLHWDELRQRPPPEGLSHEEWWVATKLARRTARRTVPLRDVEGRPFWYVLIDQLLAHLHDIDQRAAGRIATPEEVTNPATRDRYLVNSLMEEAITSSQLEGAVTTRRVAKEMLRSGRPPQSRSERMILNNYRAMRLVREWVDDEADVTPDRVLHLHQVVTEGTLDRPDAAGRLQRPGEERVLVVDPVTDEVFHRPPAADELPDRLAQVCAVARGVDAGHFLHPVLRAITVHFGLAYDHPFEDGNGRSARALFYWVMLRQGYWLAEFLTISRILRAGPAKYRRAFLLTETDEGDLTYFLLYNLEVITRAIADLDSYLRRKSEEIRTAERLLKAAARDFNHRQLALLSHALREPATFYSMRSHAMSHRTSHETARADLRHLVDRGLLEMGKDGKRFVFSAPSDLAERIRAIGEA